MGITVSGGVKVPQGKFSVYTPPPPPPGPELWAWGRNNIGQLGDETTTYRSSPVQIGALKDWSSSGSGGSDTHLIKTDGTLWGIGSALLVGNATGISRSSPVQVGALTDWASIDGAQAHKLAIKTDGSLWAWGYNSGQAPGALGLGDTNGRNSPVQVGSLTDWATVLTGRNTTFARKTNGTIWSWGNGSDGRTGLGDEVDRSSPVQIGTDTTWVDIGSGGSHFFALKTP